MRRGLSGFDLGRVSIHRSSHPIELTSLAGNFLRKLSILSTKIIHFGVLHLMEFMQALPDQVADVRIEEFLFVVAFFAVV